MQRRRRRRRASSSAARSRVFHIKAKIWSANMMSTSPRTIGEKSSGRTVALSASACTICRECTADLASSAAISVAMQPAAAASNHRRRAALSQLLASFFQDPSDAADDFPGAALPLYSLTNHPGRENFMPPAKRNEYRLASASHIWQPKSKRREKLGPRL